jgi:hypothetical protein
MQSPAGPGIGEGGEPDEDNNDVSCALQGNALIIQEASTLPDIPNDDADGRTSALDFPDAGANMAPRLVFLTLTKQPRWWLSTSTIQTLN